MNYGFYLSAAGALTSMHRQDVAANNLANVHTTGFKPDDVFLRHRLPERLEDMRPTDAKLLLEHLGGGQLVEPTLTNLKQGELIRTGNDLDLAIRGEGFFVVNSGKGEGNNKLRFTRDGRMTLNANNQIVMAATGMQILDRNDLPIEIEPGADLRIDPSGLVFENEEPITEIQIAAIPNRESLRKAGDNTFLLNSNAQGSRLQADVSLEQGYIESSAVDPIMALNEMINLTKAAQANAKMIQFHDNLMDRAINRFGRVA